MTDDILTRLMLGETVPVGTLKAGTIVTVGAIKNLIDTMPRQRYDVDLTPSDIKPIMPLTLQEMFVAQAVETSLSTDGEIVQRVITSEEWHDRFPNKK